MYRHATRLPVIWIQFIQSSPALPLGCWITKLQRSFANLHSFYGLQNRSGTLHYSLDDDDTRLRWIPRSNSWPFLDFIPPVISFGSASSNISSFWHSPILSSDECMCWLIQVHRLSPKSFASCLDCINKPLSYPKPLCQVDTFMQSWIMVMNELSSQIWP